MERKKQNKNKYYGKDVYKTELLPDNWSVIIMPDNIIMDNYHNKEPHIHPNPEKHEEQYSIQAKTMEECYNKLIEHLHRNEGLNLKKLIKEL